MVQPNENVFFRIPQKNGVPPDHRPHMAIRAITGVGWIYSTNADVAITILSINLEVDDVSFIPLDVMAAAYDSVSVGDDIFVSGFPASVIELDAPALRNGMVSAKLPDGMILIDTTTFPGNSGGPVFWKPTMGLNIFGNQIGAGRPASLIGLALYSPMYSEGAISPTSGRTRVVFEANSGLTKIVSTSKILEVLEYPESKAAVARVLGK
ncbi:MAG TPA: serine protease [Methylomirabilota bacterium]|nr:serine protease [Methylomirabilota bacterium]